MVALANLLVQLPGNGPGPHVLKVRRQCAGACARSGGYDRSDWMEVRTDCACARTHEFFVIVVCAKKIHMLFSFLGYAAAINCELRIALFLLVCSAVKAKSQNNCNGRCFLMHNNFWYNLTHIANLSHTLECPAQFNTNYCSFFNLSPNKPTASLTHLERLMKPIGTKELYFYS